MGLIVKLIVLLAATHARSTGPWVNASAGPRKPSQELEPKWLLIVTNYFFTITTNLENDSEQE